MATSESGVEQLSLIAQLGIGVFFILAVAAAVLMRNARADLADAIRQDP